MSDAGTILAGRYRLDERVGAGGAGVVYRATDLKREAQVALKLLHGGGDFDRRRFDREIAALATIEHENIVRFLDSGVAAERGPFLVMEWLDGETLTQRLKRGALSESDSLAIGVALASALACVHRAGLVHRDVKPSNVWLVGGDPASPRLIDFGIAKGGLHEGITRTGEAFGTVGYMAPEQVCGDRATDTRADVFSLGCVVFECLTGTLPFRADTPQGWLMKLALEDAARADHVSPWVSAAVSDVLAEMLAKQPADRVASMDLVRGAFEAARSATTASPASRRGPAIGLTEQRFASLLLVGADAPDSVGPLITERASYHGGVLHRAPGGLLIAFSAGESPAELARAATRLASEIAAAWPQGVLLVLSVRTTPESQSFDDAHERAQRLAAGLRAGVVVDEATHGLVRSSFECTPRGEGRGFEIELGRGAKRGRMRMVSSSPFVGRDHELAFLLAAFDRCTRERTASVVLLSGAAGVGKSRLTSEARARIRSHAASPKVLMGSADDGDSAFALLSTMLGRAMGLPLSLTDSARPELVAAVLREVGQRDGAFVGELLGELLIGPSNAPSPALGAARLEARLMRDQLGSALATLLRAIVTRGPTLMVLEHLERADIASVMFLERFLAASRGAPLLVIASARPEVRDRFPTLFAEQALTSLTVGELPPPAATALARALLGPTAELGRTLELAGGNPLFIEELARSVREGHRGALPESILALSQSRLDRFGERERRFLRAASVFGRRFPLDGAASLLASGTEHDTARRLLDAGVAREVSDQELELVSPTLREVAYASIPERELAGAHKAAAALLEKAGRGAALELARHWELAGEPARARPWFLRAGREALAAGDLDGAAKLGEKAELTAREPLEIASARVLRAEIEDMRWAWTAAEPHARGAMEIIEPGDVLWFVAAQVMMRVYMRTARIPALTELVATIRGTEPRSGARNSAVMALAVAANSMALARHPDVDATMERMEELMESLPEEASARAWGVLARGGRAFSVGDLATYHDTRREAAERFDRLFDFAKAVEAWGSAGYANALLGRYEMAESILQRCVRSAEEHGLTTVHYLRHNLGYVLLGLERYEEARVELEKTLEPLKAHAHLLRGSQRYLARALIALGDVDGAEQMALAASVTSDRPGAIASARADMAHVLLARGDVEEALSLSELAAADLTTEGAFDEDEMFMRLTLARAREASGDGSGARAVAEAAVARLAHLARKILDAEARASFLGNVVTHRALAKLAARTA